MGHHARKKNKPKAPIAPRMGPLTMRHGGERDPRLQELSDEDGVERVLAWMAFSLDRLWEAVTIELRTCDERRIADEVRRLLAMFSRTDTRWRGVKGEKTS